MREKKVLNQQWCINIAIFVPCCHSTNMYDDKKEKKKKTKHDNKTQLKPQQSDYDIYYEEWDERRKKIEIQMKRKSNPLLMNFVWLSNSARRDYDCWYFAIDIDFICAYFCRCVMYVCVRCVSVYLSKTFGKKKIMCK